MQFHRAAIPGVGLFEIIEQPAELNFVDRLMMPPQFLVQISSNDSVAQHQLNYLAADSGKSIEEVKSELDDLGKSIFAAINKGSFTWNGIGTLSGSSITSSLEIISLQPVPALKVIREKPEHQVLIGENQLSVNPSVTLFEKPLKKAGFSSLAGWIILALAIIAILYVFFVSRFSIYSFGLKSAP